MSTFDILTLSTDLLVLANDEKPRCLAKLCNAASFLNKIDCLNDEAIVLHRMLSDATDDGGQQREVISRLQGEASVMRLLLAEAAEFIDGIAAEQGLDFEDIDDSIRLVGQIRRALGQEAS